MRKADKQRPTTTGATRRHEQFTRLRGKLIARELAVTDIQQRLDPRDDLAKILERVDELLQRACATGPLPTSLRRS
jgi:hypothetical protein